MSVARDIASRVYRLAGLAAVLAAATSCGGDSRGSDAITVRDSAGIAIVENDLTRLTAACSVSTEPDMVIGAADAGEEYELHRVFGATRLSDGRIALVNQGSQQLRFYDENGRFLMSAGREGRGPGEFADAFYLWALPGDTIWVGDYRPWQFLVFGPDGQWVRTVRPTPEYANSPGIMAVLDDGRAVLAERAFSMNRAFQTVHVTAVVHGPDGTLLDTIGSYPNGRWGTVTDDPGSPSLYPLFESFARVSARGSHVVIGHGAQPQVAVLDANDGMRTDRVVRWTVADRTVTSEDIDAERQRIRDQYPDLDAEMRRRLVDPLTSEERPVAEEFPAFTSLALGRDGRIWIREFQRPRDEQRNAWIAFADDGRFACRAVLPDVDQVLEFGQDYILALDPDDLGIERVVRYALTAPAELE